MHAYIPVDLYIANGDVMRSLLIAIAMILLLIMPENRAFIYMASVMHKWDPITQRDQWFIGLGDYHCKEHPMTVKHRSELEQLLAGTDPSRCKLLLEDLSSKNADGRINCGRFVVNSRGGLLGGLTDICQRHGIATENHEYRYARVCALGPVLNQPQVNPYRFASVKGVSIGQLYNEIIHEITRLAQYDDGALLNQWYAQRIDRVKRRLVQMGWRQMATMSVADLFVDMQPEERHKKVADLLTFDSCLLDVKLVHAIAQSTEAERICAITGGSHIKRLRVILQKLGYAEVDSGLFSAEDTQTIANSIEGFEERSAEQPRPIDLQLLKKFF